MSLPWPSTSYVKLMARKSVTFAPVLSFRPVGGLTLNFAFVLYDTHMEQDTLPSQEAACSRL